MFSRLTLRRLRKKFWRPGDSDRRPFVALARASENAETAIRLFYGLNFFNLLVFAEFGTDSFENFFPLSPVWCLFWLKSLESAALYAKIFFWFNLASTLSALILPSYRPFRVLAFLGMFFFTALAHSDAGGFARMSSGMQFPLIAFLFLFPAGASAPRRLQQLKKVNAAILAQITIMAAYGNSAIWRLRGAIFGSEGIDIIAIGKNSMQAYIENWGWRMNGAGPAANFIISHPYISAPSMLAGTVLELSIFWVMFRPKYYQACGIALVIFHIGISLIFTISFLEQLLLTIVFLVCLPIRAESLKP